MGTRGRRIVTTNRDNKPRALQTGKKEVTMKFLLATFAIRVVIEMISNKRKGSQAKAENDKNKNIRHPAEFDMR